MYRLLSVLMLFLIVASAMSVRVVAQESDGSHPGNANRPTGERLLSAQRKLPSSIVRKQASDMTIEHAVKERTAPVPSLRHEPNLRLRPRGSQQIDLRSSQRNPAATVFASLGIVLGLFLTVSYISRSFQTSSNSKIPAGVIEVLGKNKLSPKQELQLVRLGPKLLLLCMSSESVDTLAEITEPHEVQQLLEVCYGQEKNAMANAFQGLLASKTHDPSHNGHDVSASLVEKYTRGDSTYA